MELGFIGEMVDPLPEAGNGQHEPGTVCRASVPLKDDRDCVKNTQEPTGSVRLSSAKDGQLKHQQQVTKDLNPSNIFSESVMTL